MAARQGGQQGGQPREIEGDEDEEKRGALAAVIKREGGGGGGDGRVARHEESMHVWRPERREVVGRDPRTVGGEALIGGVEDEHVR